MALPAGLSPPTSAAALTDIETAQGQPGNPLHGVKLETIVTALSAHYGWEDLGRRISIRCFVSEPSVASSLKFLRKTPWAREKVESLYLFMLREIRRSSPVAHNFPPPKP
jgi:uncharacterized protein (DUF2132 family)